jgi:hypothetical protein
MLLWDLEGLPQIAYYGAESRYRLEKIVKDGAVFTAPQDTVLPVAGMHAHRRQARAGGKASTPAGMRRRAFSTTAAPATAPPAVSQAQTTASLAYATPSELSSTLTDYVGVNVQVCGHFIQSL